MKKKYPDLEDYDITMIAQKIEKTGMIEEAVYKAVADQLDRVTRVLESRIDRAVRRKKIEVLEETVKSDVTLKLIKKLLEEEE